MGYGCAKSGESVRAAVRISLVLLLALVVAGDAREPGNGGHFAGFEFGATLIAHNIRSGYFDIRGLRQAVEPVPVNLHGVVVGLRFKLPLSWLRVQANLISPEWGGIDMDTLYDVPLTNGTVLNSITVRNEYIHWRTGPELQYVIAPDQPFSPFLRMGIGVNYVHAGEVGRSNDGNALFRERVQLPQAIDARSFSFDAQIGLGFDVRISPVFLLSGSYTYSYWPAVSYEYDTDMLMNPVKYSEWFRTHRIQVSFVWTGM